MIDSEALGQQEQTTPTPITRALSRPGLPLHYPPGSASPPSPLSLPFLMTKTRRQSKKQEAAAAAEPATESISASASAPSVSASQSIAVPDDIDTDFLSSLLPDVSLESPSPDAIVSVYRLVLTQATDYDATKREVEELQAEVERRDVELDQALQDKETATKELESSLETTQNELRQVRQEKDELGEYCLLYC